MNCNFKEHKHVKEAYKKLLICPLMGAEDNALCLHHCLKLQEICEKASELLRKDITREQLAENPDVLIPYLEGELLAMVQEVKLDRNWDTARNTCLACRPVMVEPYPDIVPVGTSIEATNAAVLRKIPKKGLELNPTKLNIRKELDDE